jgi:Protein of unknown function (DUF1559)
VNTPPGRLYKPALVALLLGLASVPLLAVAGVVAMVVGFRSLRRINSSDGALRGASLAIAGMALGALGTAATFVGIASIVLIRMQMNNQRLEGVDHMRRIGVALIPPPLADTPFPPATRDPHALPGDRRLSWMADLLPLMARETRSRTRFESLSGEVVRDKAWDDPANAKAAATPVRLYQAPAAPNYDPLGSAVTHFVGIGGVGADAVSLSRDDARAGMFGHDRGVRPSEVTRGLSYTLLVLDTAHDNGPWIAGDFPTARGIDADAERLIGSGAPFGGINPGFAQALWADGSVRAMRDGTPGKVLRGHATFRER